MQAYRVLVAEDDLVMRTLYERCLSREPSYRVRAARTGQEALDSIESEPPDLLLLDIDLPVIDGFGVLERLPRPRRFLVAMLTGFDDDCNRARARGLGADAFLCKIELTYHSFLEAVAALLARARGV